MAASVCDGAHSLGLCRNAPGKAVMYRDAAIPRREAVTASGEYYGKSVALGHTPAARTRMMRTEDRLLYRCCRQQLATADLEELLACVSHELDWTMVFELARNHGVAPLVWRNLEIAAIDANLSIPGAIGDKFKLSTYRNIKVKENGLEMLGGVLNCLQGLSVDVMALKGIALDLLVYDECWYTVAQDIDIILRPRGETVTPERRSAIVACVEGRGIEYEFSEHHDFTLNRALFIDFDQIWLDATAVSFSGCNLFLMSPEDMLLALCVNSCRKRYFRLRSLCDIAETIRCYSDLDWSIFVEKACKFRCNHIAYSALVVTQQTVGCSLPEGMLDGLGVGGLKQHVIDRLIGFLVHNVPLVSLSYYNGSTCISRKVGWSLLLPYATYEVGQIVSKTREAVSDSVIRAEAVHPPSGG